ncbi:MAG: TIGR00282 family metallophosphoesterase [Planctomycetes bacterium]|nr:TIGR00282 family metallophosphoesterase [Planctomycetota bacterium]
MLIKVLGIGDVVGKPGRTVIRERLRPYCQEEGVHFVVANAENVSGGNGITPAEAEELFGSGVHAITCGDHVWAKKEIIPYMDKTPAILRPANYPAEQPGRGHAVIEANGLKVGVIHLQGNVFMNTPAANPFRTADACLEELRQHTPVLVIDMHGEATSEKVAMGWHTDGRASFVFGTHTHIQTADERVLPQGTAYITDCGMTGPYESVIGRRVDRVLHKLVTGMPAPFDVATGDVRLCGAVATIDSDTGRAVAVKRVVLLLQ